MAKRDKSRETPIAVQDLASPVQGASEQSEQVKGGMITYTFSATGRAGNVAAQQLLGSEKAVGK